MYEFLQKVMEDPRFAGNMDPSAWKGLEWSRMDVALLGRGAVFEPDFPIDEEYKPVVYRHVAPDRVFIYHCGDDSLRVHVQNGEVVAWMLDNFGQ